MTQFLVTSLLPFDSTCTHKSPFRLILKKDKVAQSIQKETKLQLCTGTKVLATWISLDRTFLGKNFFIFSCISQWPGKKKVSKCGYLYPLVVTFVERLHLGQVAVWSRRPVHWIRNKEPKEQFFSPFLPVWLSTLRVVARARIYFVPPLALPVVSAIDFVAVNHVWSFISQLSSYICLAKRRRRKRNKKKEKMRMKMNPITSSILYIAGRGVFFLMDEDDKDAGWRRRRSSR